MAQIYQENLEFYFQELRNRDAQRQTAAAARIAEQVHIIFRELTPTEFGRFNTDLQNRMSSMILNGADTHERTGGLYLVNALIDFRGDDATNRITKFHNYIKRTLEGNDTSAMIVAAKCLGRLATPGAAYSTDLVEAQVVQAMEWLTSERNENRRFAAVLVLGELARHSSTLIRHHIPMILAAIWEALRDPKVVIREKAADAVSQCFRAWSARDQQDRQACLLQMYNEAQSSLRRGTVEATHAALLVYRELLTQGGMFMHSRYKEVCERVLLPANREHKDPTIRRTIVDIIPTLANYAPKEFCQNYLARSMQHLQSLLRDPKQRNTAFVAIGNIATAVGSQIAPYLDTILLHIREALSVRTRSRMSGDDAAIFGLV